VIRTAEPIAEPRAGSLRWSWLLSLAARADAVAAGGLLLATLAFYYPLVFLGRVLVDYDAFVFFYPQRAYLARALQSGRIPLWDPSLFLGAPFLANPQTAVLYPPSWLFVLGPPEAIYSVQLVLHGFLAAWFTYLLMRRAFDASPLAAALGGLAYAFGGFAVGQVGHLNQISAAAWLPAVLLAYDRFVVTGRLYWIGLGALALAMQLLAGHPQETYMTLIALGVFGLVRAPWRSFSRLAWTTVAGGVMCLLGADLAAAQLLPTLELAPLSIRGGGISWPDAVAGSLPSYLAVRALFPPYWIRVPYTEYLGYAGVVPVVLGLLALLFGRARGVIFGTLLCALGLFLALGENNGFYPLIFSSVPGFDTFRVPARWLLLWEFGAAVLGALGADWIGRGSRVDVRRRSLWLRVALLSLLLMAGLAWQRNEGEPFPQRRTPVLIAGIAAATLAIGALPHFGRPVVAVGLLVALTGGELWAAGDASPGRQAAPRAFNDGESVEWLAPRVAPGDRLLSLARPEYVPAVEAQVRTELSGLPPPIVDSVLIAQKWRDTLTPNLPLQFGLDTADGYDGGVLPLQRWLRLNTLLLADQRSDGVLLSRLQQVPRERLLDLLGVRYLIVNAATPPPSGMQLIDFHDLELLVRDAPVARSLIVYNARAGDDDAALAAMARDDFDPNRQVVVAGYLLQREAWYPGWRARVDGIDTPVERADLVFRAVPLSAGDHDVEIYFEPASFRRGALLSLAGLFAIVILFSWPWLPIIGKRARS
jgi:hypothetical protein